MPAELGSQLGSQALSQPRIQLQLGIFMVRGYSPRPLFSAKTFFYSPNAGRTYLFTAPNRSRECERLDAFLQKLTG